VSRCAARLLGSAALLLALACKRAPEPTAAAEAQVCGRLVFVESDADGRAHVRMIAATGGPITSLAAPLDTEESLFPAAISPDDRRMLLLSSREGDDGSSHDRLWLAALDGSAADARPLPIELARQLRSPSWAPDGRWFVLESAQHSFRDLYRVDVESASVLRLTDDPQGNFEPSISPDGQTIAFVSSRDGNAEIYAMNSDGGDPRRLTNSPRDDTSPRWSPDGRTLAFCSARERERGVDVFSMATDGTEQRPLLGEHQRREPILASQPEFSPDGSLLAFSELNPKQGTAAIVIVALDRNEVVQRIVGDGVYEQPSWSPDGEFVAFARSQAGRVNIARARVETGEVVDVTDGVREQWLPRWITDPECPRVVLAVDNDTHSS
jgi:TolB protein